MAGNDATRAGCPVEEYSTAGPRREPLAHFRRLDELRARSRPYFWDATEFQVDRGPTRHIAFGAGPHRCLGSHLARQEMAIALEEWHRRIPAYRLDPDRPVIEHGGGVYGLDSLPLVWERDGTT